MTQNILLVSLILINLTSCVPIPQDIMRPPAETLKIREQQSRTFEVNSDKQLLRSSISVLQDMGYAIKESSSDYGVLTATKEASAISSGQVLLCVASIALGSKPPPIDKTQYITVTVVIIDNHECGKATARATFQRIIEKTDGSKNSEIVTDQNVYCEFYEKLDKSLFLEVNRI